MTDETPPERQRGPHRDFAARLDRLAELARQGAFRNAAAMFAQHVDARPAPRRPKLRVIEGGRS